jgi:hypothetical protein
LDMYTRGGDPGFQGGMHIKKLRRAEGGTKIFGVFRVKNHDFTPKNHIFSNFRGGRAPGTPPSESAPGYFSSENIFSVFGVHKQCLSCVCRQ